MKLVVNPIRCDAHGLCAEILPERVSLDDWGYPIIDTEPITRGQLRHAQRAVATCPVFALKLQAAGTPMSHRKQDTTDR